MRPLRTALLLLAMMLALAGCGSGDDVQEVPGAPAELTVPHQKGAADLSEDASGSATPTPTPSADGDATPAPTADSGTTGSTGTTGTNTGAAATPAPATEDSPTTDTAPPAGSAPEKFEQFCQENAGAC